MEITLLIVTLPFFLVPFLLVTASPGIVTYVAANVLLPVAIAVLTVGSLVNGEGAGMIFTYPAPAAIVFGWLAGAIWWIFRKHQSDERPRSTMQSAIASTTGYATAAALTVLVTIPLWQPMAVGLLR